MPYTPTQNPYGAIGALLGPGLDAIVAAAPATIDDLVTAVNTYIQTTFYPSASTQVQIEISSIAYHAINAYNNNLVLSGEAMYSRVQVPFIAMLIGNNTNNIQPDTIQQWIDDVQDNVGISDLMVNDQIPLLLATTLGTNAVAYWAKQLGNPAGSWATNYFSGNNYEDYINSLLWDKAAMNGAFAGYGATSSGLIEPTVNKVSTNMISALIGALTVTAGKVIFGWIPRITKPLLIDMYYKYPVINNGNNGGPSWMYNISPTHTPDTQLPSGSGGDCEEPDDGPDTTSHPAIMRY